MTRETHAAILEVALLLLLEESDDKLSRREEWMTRENIEWCLENTAYPNTALEDTMERLILCSKLGVV